MKTSLLSTILLAAAIAMPAVAQEEDGGNIVQVFYFDVKTGHGDEFRDGFKAYWDCYRENGGTRSWSAWYPVSGSLSGVLFRSGGHDWSDFDEESPVGDACNDVFETSVQPHYDDIYSGFDAALNEVSRPTDATITVVRAVDFEVSDYSAAMEVISAWHEAMVATGRGKYMWFSKVTSTSGWDLTVAILNEDFADMAPEDKSFREIQETHHGKKKADQLFAKWNGLVKRSRSRMWRKGNDLSYTPAE